MALTAIEIFKNLPKTNCRDCGVPTCLAFAMQLAAKKVELIGGTYGQPLGTMFSGESNIRQRIYGVRAVMRLLGYRPRTFWEEEFDFFPQLPQMLNGVEFEYGRMKVLGPKAVAEFTKRGLSRLTMSAAGPTTST